MLGRFHRFPLYRLFARSCSDTSVQSDATSSAPIVAWAGKISIMDTVITSHDASTGAPDERLEGRAFIAALSLENLEKGKVHTSRMDVERSDISYLGNEGDYHNDIGEPFGHAITKTPPETRMWRQGYRQSVWLNVRGTGTVMRAGFSRESIILARAHVRSPALCLELDRSALAEVRVLIRHHGLTSQPRLEHTDWGLRCSSDPNARR